MIAGELVGVGAAAGTGNDAAVVDVAVGGDGGDHGGGGVEAGDCPMPDAPASPVLVD